MAIDRREWRAAGWLAATITGYTIAVLASGRVDARDFARLFGTYLQGAFALWTVVGLGGLVVVMVRHAVAPLAADRPAPLVFFAALARERWARDRGVSLLLPPLLFALLMAAFNAFKQRILIEAGFGLDPLFAAADRWLFVGHDPWVITHWLLPWPRATFLIDQAYHGWFAPMSLGVVLCAWLPRNSFGLRVQYLIAYVAVWIVIGSLLAYLLPAAGPDFYASVGHGDQFRPLAVRLAADQGALQTVLPGARLITPGTVAMLINLQSAPHLAIGAGVSAMPSVHNALAVLFALAALRIHRLLGSVFAAYAALIWIGSIDLGWHYAIDGIVAAILTSVIWWVAGLAAAALDRGPAARSLAPAPVAVAMD